MARRSNDHRGLASSVLSSVMRVSFEVLDAVAEGQMSTEEAAASLGISPADVSRRVEMLQFARVFSHNERHAARTRLIRTTLSVFAVTALTSTVWFVHTARAAGNCAQTLPGPLVTFCPDNPALAAEVNGNFSTLATSLINKAGPLSNTNLVSTNAALTTPTITGVSAFNGQIQANGGGAMPIDFFGNTYGLGVQNSTSYFRTGGGFAWFAGGTHVGANTNDPGAGGSVLATLDGAGVFRPRSIDVVTINGRRPAYVVTNSCAASSCTATCGSGLVKMAFGFHGIGANGTSGSWQCPGSFQWLGACMGQASCTVTTGCSSSGIFLECW